MKKEVIVEGYIKEIPKKAFKSFSESLKMTVAGMLIMSSMSVIADTSLPVISKMSNHTSQLQNYKEDNKIKKLQEALTIRKDHLMDREVFKSYQFFSDHVSEKYNTENANGVTMNTMKNVISIFLLKNNLMDKSNGDVGLGAFNFNRSYAVSPSTKDFISKNTSIFDHYEKHVAIKFLDKAYKTKIDSLDTEAQSIHANIKSLNYEEVVQTLDDLKTRQNNKINLSSKRNTLKNNS